mgnify:CR=1 FL=1
MVHLESVFTKNQIVRKDRSHSIILVGVVWKLLRIWGKAFDPLARCDIYQLDLDLRFGNFLQQQGLQQGQHQHIIISRSYHRLEEGPNPIQE